MDDYLEYLNRTSAFMALDDREEQFRGLTRWLDNYYGNNASKKVFSGYKPSDIDTLRDLCSAQNSAVIFVICQQA